MTSQKPRTVPQYRLTVIMVHAMILITTAGIGIMTGSLFGTSSFLSWLTVLLPWFVITWSLTEMKPRIRELGYWVLAIITIPFVVLGAFSGWGMLFMLGMVFLIFGAWMERERAG
ncbi:MAG: hypothetical protein KC435_14130 [Thermomicrobiales bacterium]|nr:hypothetical protein [Thermomicrobiales bacterium]